MPGGKGSVSGPQASDPEPSIKWKTQVRGQNLKVDLLIGELFRRFTRQLPVLLLKGPSIATWLYADPSERVYNDCDLLIHPDAYVQISTSLSELGFAKRSGAVGVSDRPIHAENWVRSMDGAVVDLHTALIGIHLPADQAFDMLSSRSELMLVRDVPVPILDPAGRTFLIGLHAAQHGSELGKALADLELALEKVPVPVWREAARLAASLEAVDAFASGLRLVQAGVARAAELELPADADAEAILRASTAPHLSLGFEWLSRVPGLRPKILFVLTKLFPPPAYMRAVSGREDAGPAALGRMYLERVLWMVRHAPRGFRAWLAARRGRGRT